MSKESKKDNQTEIYRKCKILEIMQNLTWILWAEKISLVVDYFLSIYEVLRSTPRRPNLKT